MLFNQSHVFDRSGIAALSDLQTSQWHELFELLENEQKIFLRKEPDFRSAEYKWPRDPLHTWSRVWEYPYVYYHLKCWREKSTNVSDIPHVVDLGSGVTFFPFSVARLGYKVTCTDIDPICKIDLERAIKKVDHKPGEVEFRMGEELKLPFCDREVDVVYCISVLEHIPTFDSTLEEIGRILKPEGLLILTIDLDLRGDSDLGIDKYEYLYSLLRKNYIFTNPDITIHPADILFSTSGPYAVTAPKISGIKLLKFTLKEKVIRPIFGSKPAHLKPPFELAIGAFAIQKEG
jgi:SAM-dependent methyltransferase